MTDQAFTPQAQEMPSLTVKAIRAKYPSPIPATGQNCIDGEYCVLGAACKFILKEFALPFPDPLVAASFLGIPDKDAECIAEQNDEGNMEGAWAILDATLKRKARASTSPEAQK